MMTHERHGPLRVASHSLNTLSRSTLPKFYVTGSCIYLFCAKCKQPGFIGLKRCQVQNMSRRSDSVKNMYQVNGSNSVCVCVCLRVCVFVSSLSLFLSLSFSLSLFLSLYLSLCMCTAILVIPIDHNLGTTFSIFSIGPFVEL